MLVGGAGSGGSAVAGSSGSANAGSGGSSSGSGGMPAAGGVSGSSGGVSGSAGAGGSGGAPVTCAPACSTDKACIAGQCLPKPVELTRAPGCGNMFLALNKGTLYFTDSAHGFVKSIATTGGPETTIASGQKLPYAITVDDTNVYWSNTSTTAATAADNTIMMAALSKGTPTKITDVDQSTAQTGKTTPVLGLTLDGKGALYFGDQATLMKVDAKPASTASKIGSFEGNPTVIVVTPTRIFTTLGLDNAVQWRNPDPANSGCADPVARPMGSTVGGCAFIESQGQLLFNALTLAGTQIIWANSNTLNSADTMVPATMQGTGHTITSNDSGNNITGFANNATTVYFGETKSGIIEKASLPDGDPVILVKDPDNEKAPSSFVIDATNVYWRTDDTCAIMKLAL